MNETAELHTFGLRVYYEDTDAEGIVYYANYLKFIERARSEFLRDIGWPPSKIWEDFKNYWVVKNCSIDYKKPAVLDDWLEVQTSVEKLRPASLFLKQDVFREGELLTSVSIRLAYLHENGQIAQIPKAISALMMPYLFAESS
ncbi:YbgC/FadM family acyl-CoA thioesterase [Alphaproteobacteria bacterium]|jgi:acyl-CoA thioester hydrolase|nr:YbgC/FadM family acyl-CoA thioesterase [Alphaproteobacteria bacterium]